MNGLITFLDFIIPRFITELTLATIDEDKNVNVISPLKYAIQEDLDKATHFVEVKGFNLFGIMIGCKPITVISKKEYLEVLNEIEDEQ